MSTSRKVIASVPESERAGTIKEFSPDKELPTERTLGVNFNVERDGFTFDVNLKRKSEDKPVTKRVMLSIAASLF